MAGLDLVKVLREEGVSAAKALASRPAGKEMLRLLEAGSAQHVVALKLDRLFRDAVDALTISRDWDCARVALHLVDMGGQTINTASPMGRMFLTMMAGFAELERNLVSERTSLAMHHMQAEGRHLGAPPLGAEMIQGALVGIADEMATTRRMKALRNQGLTLQQIADTLTAEGLKTKRGGAWHPTTVARSLERMG
jgi:DNA invertase Pin-like site-specific DNA recombinase